jgi:hypothetical protein
MYKVELKTKRAEKLEVVNFSDLQLKERFDVEVWVNNNPMILKEELLIISEQTILPSGRQPDLLALDKKGNLVIIELKRDDSGRDVYWQAITYAAQFSEYSFNDIIEMYEEYLKSNGKDLSKGRELIELFIEEEIENLNQNQRIILVSKEFHQDVLKASLWLLDYGIDLKIIKLTPYKYSDDLLLLDSEVLIPTPGVEDYIKGKAKKIKESQTYDSNWSSLKGNYEDPELTEKLKETLQRDSNLTSRLKAFIEILLSENRVFGRKEIKESFYNDYEIGNSLGHAGRLMSNVSQYLTKKDNDHLRQIIEFGMEQESAGAPKDNFKIVPEYRELLIKVLGDLESQNDN